MSQITQFGTRREGLDYLPRTAAYGILEREGKIACVRIGYDNYTYDLPGGALDPGESAQQAVVREFGEETGLAVEAGRPVTEILHYLQNDEGTPYNNHGHFFEMRLLGERPEAKCEPDHELVWLNPLQVLTHLKHEGYAWAVVLWLRTRFRGGGAG